MIVLGVILLVIGVLTGLGILQAFGEILLVIGLILLVVGHAHGPVFGDRRYWW